MSRPEPTQQSCLNQKMDYAAYVIGGLGSRWCRESRMTGPTPKNLSSSVDTINEMAYVYYMMRAMYGEAYLFIGDGI